MPQKKTKKQQSSAANQPNALASKSSVLRRMMEQQPLSSTGLTKDITLKAFAQYWLTQLKTDLKKSTVYAYNNALNNHICRVFEGMKLSDITSEDVQLFIMSLVDGMDLDDPLSPKSIRNIHGVLHKMFQDAYDMKVIDENPAKHTKLPKLKKPEIIPMNNNQIHAFLTAIIGHELEIFFKLALFTGMRKAELIGLTWDCFNFTEGSIRVYRQLSYDKTRRIYFFDTVKNGKPRTIFPASDVMDAGVTVFDREGIMKKLISMTAAAVMCCLLTSCGRTEINVNNYLTTEVNGYDGEGYAGWNVDLGQLVKDNYQAFGLKEGYPVTDYQAVLEKLKNNLKADYDKAEDLSNGDTIKFAWDNSNLKSLESDYKVKFKTEDVEVKVSGLQEVVDLNVFDYIKLQYTGTAPNASVMVDNSALADLNLPLTINFEVTPQDGLNLGDKVKVKLIEGTAEACLLSGYRLTETEHEYTVEGLDAYLMSLDDLPADASDNMNSHGQDLLNAEIASYWENPADLDSITLRGNYLLTTKEGLIQNVNDALVYVYEIKTKDFSYFSYVEYDNVMLLSDGTCSFNLQEAFQPVGSVAMGMPYGTTFERSGLNYIGYADLDTLFNEVVTQRIASYDYKSTVT